MSRSVKSSPWTPARVGKVLSPDPQYRKDGNKVWRDSRQCGRQHIEPCARRTRVADQSRRLAVGVWPTAGGAGSGARRLSIGGGIMPLWQGRSLRPIKSVTESGAEQTVVDRATNLKQHICAISRQSHLLRARIHRRLHTERMAGLTLWRYGGRPTLLRSMPCKFTRTAAIKS
jgi:hypothetical protein